MLKSAPTDEKGAGGRSEVVLTTQHVSPGFFFCFVFNIEMGTERRNMWDRTGGDVETRRRAC